MGQKGTTISLKQGFFKFRGELKDDKFLFFEWSYSIIKKLTATIVFLGKHLVLDFSSWVFLAISIMGPMSCLLEGWGQKVVIPFFLDAFFFKVKKVLLNTLCFTFIQCITGLNILCRSSINSREPDSTIFKVLDYVHIFCITYWNT